METLNESVLTSDIDLSFVAHLVPGLEVASIGAEQVVIGGPSRLLVLNPTAALILQFLDGEATTGALVDDFTEALGVDREVVEGDVLAFMRELGSAGLLEGVAPPPPELPEGIDLAELDWTPLEPIEVGDQLDEFTLPDLDGADRTLSEFRPERVLLVNWSPGCGFCVQIAGELAALDPLLAEHGVRLVLVTQGDADSNRALHDEHRIVAPTLLRGDTGVDPFRGTGTPAAYLLDADGALAEAMVTGADQVPTLARDLAGLELAPPFGTTPELEDDELDADEVRGTYLPAPGAMCGPGGGAGTSNSTEWQGTRVYALGEYHIGLRYDTSETAALLDRLFARARVNDRRAPDNYSVALGGTPTTKGAGTSRSLKLLVHGGTQLVRSRSGGRVLAALLQHLSGELEPVDPALSQVNATAVVCDGEALLLPPGLVEFVKVLQPRLAKAGMTMVDTPRTLLDLGARELVVPEVTLGHDASVLEDLDAAAQLGNELPWVRSGRYPLRAWYFSRSPEHRGRLTPGVAVTAALPSCFDVEDVRGTVERLADLFADVTPYGIWYDGVNDFVDQVSAPLR